MNKYILPLWGCRSCRFCSLCRLGHAVNEKTSSVSDKCFERRIFVFEYLKTARGGCWQEESKWPIHRSLSVMSRYISLQTSTSTQPFNSHFLTSVPASMTMRKERRTAQPDLPLLCGAPLVLWMAARYPLPSAFPSLDLLPSKRLSR